MKGQQHLQFLEALVQTVPPPAAPINHGLAGNGELAKLPPDLTAFLERSGSACFTAGGEALVGIFNPADEEDHEGRDGLLESLRGHQEAEGDRYLPLELFPASPGLFLWGWGENQQQYLWYTKGKPARWHVYTY